MDTSSLRQLSTLAIVGLQVDRLFKPAIVDCTTPVRPACCGTRVKHLMMPEGAPRSRCTAGAQSLLYTAVALSSRALPSIAPPLWLCCAPLVLEQLLIDPA